VRTACERGPRKQAVGGGPGQQVGGSAELVRGCGAAAGWHPGLSGRKLRPWRPSSVRPQT
jgi:hypothetical protein